MSQVSRIVFAIVKIVKTMVKYKLSNCLSLILLMTSLETNFTKTFRRSYLLRWVCPISKKLDFFRRIFKIWQILSQHWRWGWWRWQARKSGHLDLQAKYPSSSSSSSSSSMQTSSSSSASSSPVLNSHTAPCVLVVTMIMIMYREGPIMGATLSTGYQTWEVKVLSSSSSSSPMLYQVMGNLPKNNTWTNIAIRWEPLKFNDEVGWWWWSRWWWWWRRLSWWSRWWSWWSW